MQHMQKPTLVIVNEQFSDIYCSLFEEKSGRRIGTFSHFPFSANT
jgi:hypothetical protein